MGIARNFTTLEANFLSNTWENLEVTVHFRYYSKIWNIYIFVNFNDVFTSNHVWLTAMAAKIDASGKNYNLKNSKFPHVMVKGPASAG